MGQKGSSTWKGTIEALLQKISLEWKPVSRISAAMGSNWKPSGIMWLVLLVTWKRNNSHQGRGFVGFFGGGVWVGVFLILFLEFYCLFVWCFCLFGCGAFLLCFLCLSKAVSGEQRSEKTSSVLFHYLWEIGKILRESTAFWADWNVDEKRCDFFPEVTQ